jgi:CHASE3 domain sensor protein
METGFRGALERLLQCEVDTVWVLRRAQRHTHNPALKRQLEVLLRYRRRRVLALVKELRAFGLDPDGESLFDEGLSALRTAWLQTRIAFQGVLGDAALLRMAIDQAQCAESAAREALARPLPSDLRDTLSKMVRQEHKALRALNQVLVVAAPAPESESAHP